VNLAYNSDKRRYVRYELLDYAVMSVDGEINPVNIVITDIGLGGIQIRSKSTLVSGSKCTIHVACMDGTDLDLRGEVRHATAVNNSDLYSAGVRFIPENHLERMAVAEFVHQVFQRQADDLAG
jgi:c-di-GMP-binding flagellar brake protein YcgR